MPIDDFVELLVDEIDGKIRSATLGFSQTGRLVLGGTSGPGGGSGGPPGGFIGKLSQKYITYDETELAASGGAASLVDNLNHIRYDVEENATDIAVISGAIAEGVVTDYVSLSDTPDSFENFGGAVTVVSEAEDSIVFSGSIAHLNFNKLNLNQTVNEDFIFGKDIDELASSPDIIFQTPATANDRGEIIFRDASAAPPTPRPFTAGNTGQTAPGDTLSANLSHTVADNEYRVLVVGVAIRGGKSVASVVFDGDAFSKAGHIQPGGDIRSEIWYLEDPSVGTFDITVTLANNQTFTFSATDFYNVDSLGAYSSTSGRAVGVITAKGDATNQIYDCLALQSSNSSIEVTPANTEQTELIAEHPSSVSIGTSIIEGSETSDSDWTFSNDYYAISFLELNEIVVGEAEGIDILTLGDSQATFQGDVTLESGSFDMSSNDILNANIDGGNF